MKTIKRLAAVALLCAGCAVSYYMGYNAQSKPVENNKHYEAACRMADVIRCYQDHLSEDSIIQDYGCFEEIVGTFLDEYNDGTPVNLEEYSWCY